MEKMAPGTNQSSFVLWAPKVNLLHTMVEEMAPQANQNSVVQWAPMANPLYLAAGLTLKVNQTHYML